MIFRKALDTYDTGNRNKFIDEYMKDIEEHKRRQEELKLKRLQEKIIGYQPKLRPLEETIKRVSINPERLTSKRLPSQLRVTQRRKTQGFDLQTVQEGGTKYNSLTVEQLKEKIKKKPMAQEYLAESKVARPRKALLIQALLVAKSKKPQSSGSKRKAP